MIQVENLRKSFGAVQAVDTITFRVSPGEIYGLLGPNGAGKTTTISCISGLLKPDAGQVSIDDADLSIDPLRARRVLGIVPQETAIYDTLTARENVSYFAALHGLGGAERRKRVGLAAESKQSSKKFSGGMKRRLNLAIGLVSDPKVLLLDEPTVGIDPQARIHILDVVRDVQRQGTAILYTTHYLEEAESLCDRIGIMDHGRILAEGTIPELRRRVGEGTVVTLKGRFSAETLRSVLPANGVAQVIALEDNSAVLSVRGESGPASEILSAVLKAGIELTDITMQEPTLQNLFIKLTGRDLRD